MIVYFSNVSGYTKRFINKLDLPNVAIPLYTKEESPVMEEPFILVFPSYGRGSAKAAVPKQVIKFLNIEQNRDNLLGIVGVGNRTFGENYQIGARIVEHKTGKPILYALELFGTPEDVRNVRDIYATRLPRS